MTEPTREPRISSSLADKMAASIATLNSQLEQARRDRDSFAVTAGALRLQVREIVKFIDHEMSYESGEDDPADFEYYGDRQYIIEEARRRLENLAPADEDQAERTAATPAEAARALFAPEAPATCNDPCPQADNAPCSRPTGHAPEGLNHSNGFSSWAP